MKKLLISGLIITAMSGCYTIINQPSVLPETASGNVVENNVINVENLYSSPYYYNAYFDDWDYGYYMDGRYYNRPYYVDRTHLRYDWFSGTWYYDPFYYNNRSFYYDNRWYHYQPAPISGGGTTVEPPTQTQRDRNISRIPGSAVPPAGSPDGISTGTVGGQTYVISGKTTTSTSSGTTTAKKTTTTGASTQVNTSKNDPEPSSGNTDTSNDSNKKTRRTKTRSR